MRGNVASPHRGESVKNSDKCDDFEKLRSAFGEGDGGSTPIILIFLEIERRRYCWYDRHTEVSRTLPPKSVGILYTARASARLWLVQE
jgi:hypothetical protein